MKTKFSVPPEWKERQEKIIPKEMNAMKIGLFTATYLDMQLKDVFKLATGLGYEAVEMPAFTNNPHLDIEEIVKGNKAADEDTGKG